MKKVRLENNMKIIGIKNFKGTAKKIDYYLVTKDHKKLYAFCNVYTHNSYNLCKSGILVNDLTSRRSRDTGIMRLVDQVNRMLPYLVEIYDLPVAV